MSSRLRVTVPYRSNFSSTRTKLSCTIFVEFFSRIEVFSSSNFLNPHNGTDGKVLVLSVEKVKSEI